MNIKFVHTPKRLEENERLRQLQIMIPPIGIWSLADASARNGNPTEIIHAGIESLADPAFSLCDYLAAQQTDIVCFSLHWHPQIYEVRESTLAVKNALPDIKIVLGGISSSAFACDIMGKWSHVDYVIRGEAERTISLMTSSSNFVPSETPNLSWRNNGVAIHNPATYSAGNNDLDAFSHTGLRLMKNWEHYRGRYFYDSNETFEKWSAAPRVWYLYAGRGCSVNCAYCGGGSDAHLQMAGRKGISFRRPESVLADINQLSEEFGAQSFYVCYHPSEMSADYYKTLFRALRGGPKHSMIFEYYNSIPDTDFIDLFSKAFDLGRSQLVFSPTAFTESARNKFCPSAFSDNVFEKLLQRCETNRIQTVLFYSPLPQENRDETLRAAERAASLLKKFSRLAIIVMPIEIEPLSPWVLEPNKFGMTLIRKTFDDYVNHHGKRRGVFTEEDLGYSFPGFESLMDRLRSMSDDPRWVVFQPYLYDSHGG